MGNSYWALIALDISMLIIASLSIPAEIINSMQSMPMFTLIGTKYCRFWHLLNTNFHHVPSALLHQMRPEWQSVAIFFACLVLSDTCIRQMRPIPFLKRKLDGKNARFAGIQSTFLIPGHYDGVQGPHIQLLKRAKMFFYVW